MNNAELIKALRYHADATIHNCDGCPYQTIHKTNGMCIDCMMIDAADALEKLQSDWEYCSDLLNIAIRTTGISMTALVKLYEIERADGERSKHDELPDC